MDNKSYQFELPPHKESIIKVIGVGGGGSNAVDYMYRQGIKDVEFIVCNTDRQALERSVVPSKLQIGATLTEGLGAGASPEKGQKAALESKSEIVEMLKNNTRMLFITAGMGGGTGTGAAPEIAKLASEMDVLTVAIVTLPFGFEGQQKMEQAKKGVAALREACDTVLVILNEKLKEIHGKFTLSEAFAKADNILTTASKGIAEIITVPGQINVDFEDVKTVMKGSGNAVMGSGMANGEDRAMRVVEQATTSPLLNDQNLHGAKKILLCVTSPKDAEIQMDELGIITDFVKSKLGQHAHLIFGNYVDDTIGDNIHVTIIATDFKHQGEDVEKTKRIIDLDNPRMEAVRTKPSYAHGLSSNGNGHEASEAQDAKEPYSLEWKYKLSDKEGSSYRVETEAQDEALFSTPAAQDEDPQIEELEGSAIKMSRKHALISEREERIQKFTLRQARHLDTEALKEKLEVAAFIRRKVHLHEIPPVSKKSTYTLSTDEKSKTVNKNRFFDDQVD